MLLKKCINLYGNFEGKILNIPELQVSKLYLNISTLAT
jgi:hypothetical protein